MISVHCYVFGVRTIQNGSVFDQWNRPSFHGEKKRIVMTGKTEQGTMKYLGIRWVQY